MSLQSITFNCEIVTPMFCGNAKQEAELRPSAIKGAVRFWWRAMNGHLPIEELRKQEAAIFGSADEKVGRSKIILEVENGCNQTTRVFDSYTTNRQIKKGTSLEQTIQVNIIEFLAFGPVAVVNREKVYRPYFEPSSSSSFKLTIRHPSGFSITSIKDALLLCSVFGGLGARSRNGFGRFKVAEFTYDEDTLKQLLTTETELSTFTSSSLHAKLYALQTHQTTWRNVLCELGMKYLKARVKYQESAATTSRNNFGIDRERQFQNRPYIGSPLITPDGQMPLRAAAPAQDLMLERHAKTHFFGIRKEGNNLYGYILHLPYDYLNGYTLPSGAPLPNRNKYKDAYDNATNALNEALSSPHKQNMRIIIP